MSFVFVRHRTSRFNSLQSVPYNFSESNPKQKSDNRMTTEYTTEKRKEVQSSPHNELNLFQPKEVGCKRVFPASDHWAAAGQ